MKRLEGEMAKDLVSSLAQLKKRVQASRLSSIKEKLKKNEKNLEAHTSHFCALAMSKSGLCMIDQNTSKNVLTLRLGNTLCDFDGTNSGSVEKDLVNSQEEVLSSGILFGHSSKGKSLIRLIKLPIIEKIPPYTTWIFVDRNQRMAEDQSVVGRRQIYYDPCGSETLICSDSEEDIAEPQEEKREFSEGEDHILWNAIQEHGLKLEVLNTLHQFIDASSTEIQERYEVLLRKYQETKDAEFSGEAEPATKTFLDKTLSLALDSFDNLFCRRCLIFDCHLHGCSQTVVIPSEKLPSTFEPDENMKPCSEQCYLRRKDAKESETGVTLETDSREDLKESKTGATMEVESFSLTETLVTVPLETGDSDMRPVDEQAKISVSNIKYNDSGRHIVFPHAVHKGGDPTPEGTTDSELLLKSMGKRKAQKSMLVGTMKESAEKILSSSDKKQKKLRISDVVSRVSKDMLNINISDSKDPCALPEVQLQDKVLCELSTNDHKMDRCQRKDSNAGEDMADSVKGPPSVKSCKSSKRQGSQNWSPIERDLYLKGLEIFGKNSCLIARNLLPGLKTCLEVSNYMYSDAATMLNRPMLTNSCADDHIAEPDYMEQDMSTRTRIWRRRGRARKLKYTWKSAGHPSFRKQIVDGKHQSCKQYTPCGCQQMCGKQCPCLHNGTCCEKYCGCSKSCKNRFRGCHCAKSQCRSRQCPCFAAGRECDPDVCRNCWVSCGDGSLGGPPGRSDGYQCGNMNLLLKQKQRILLAKSDVAGWGAFIKNPVNKNDYLGEYTGELISHKEADKRGKIYDRANSSFLFDLNDQYVLDAFRKGDKLKFANHSSNPNCYAKVMLVAGDHRVGIFAKEHIEASEELFYDYRYGPDQAPAWARKPGASKRDDSSVSHGRAQKIA